MENPTNNAIPHGFSVATVLLLTAVVAIGMAAIRIQVIHLDQTDRTKLPATFWSQQEPSLFQRQVEELALQALAGGVIGLFVGIGIGVTRQRPVIGTLLAIPVSIFTGAFAGAVSTDRENVALVAIGSVLLVLMGVVIRALSSRSE